ncbi:L-fucose:H+ symporter permease [Pontibacter silvestris]|uniref:L-fucose:H+ symporter permease n=1 Tax=Pontibacter silvestris TaxID=2305183 RepID=A0ABW4X116_9BACT|nr:L-fucose:H+ symporter permease [Pontibacter silvestris]MCC9135583.1 L-fucose:H+ symporter permease [Pontibacter silvestris]
MSEKVQKAPLISSGNTWAFVLITSLFFLWGLANNMTDTLLAAFKRIMSMSDFQTSWIQMAFYGSYFCLALPAAILIKKYSYKTGILLGLGLFILGSLLFYPASITMSYTHFLVALYVLAGGLSVLETAANPYIVAMGAEDSGTRRLNLAQAFNPIGSITGVLLSKVFILSRLNLSGAEERAAMSAEQLRNVQSEELTAVMGPYVGVAFFLIVLWVVVKLTDMPKGSDAGSKLDLGTAFRRLAMNPHYVWAVVAQFFYVGAQIGVWSFTIRYVMQELRLDEEGAVSYYMVALVLFMACRFVFTFLMRYISPRLLLLGTAVAACVCMLIVIYGSGQVGVWALVATSGCMSLMFPTIYGLGIRGLGQDTKIGGSGLVMAILGGAVLTAVQGQVSDAAQDVSTAFYVPLACFTVVAIYALTKGKPKTVSKKVHSKSTAALSDEPLKEVVQ